ncbi:MAG TPA: hypothetical protein VFA47_08485 [Candidatus Manganitrophaceae bacterium]|nr:hypothetical protein [Candidatus Manganitrophaceae bacterium]
MKEDNLATPDSQLKWSEEAKFREVHCGYQNDTLRRFRREEVRKNRRNTETLNTMGGLKMVKVALFVRLEAKPGKEKEVETFLRGGLSIVQEEPATTTWYAIRLGPSAFGIFDTFPDEGGRQAHLSGRVAAALMAKASDLLAKPPVIEKVDILAAKLPK